MNPRRDVNPIKRSVQIVQMSSGPTTERRTLCQSIIYAKFGALHVKAPRPALNSFISRPRPMRADYNLHTSAATLSKLAFTNNHPTTKVYSAFKQNLSFRQRVFGTTHNGSRRCGVSPDGLSLSSLCRNNRQVVLSSVIPAVSF